MVLQCAEGAKSNDPERFEFARYASYAQRERMSFKLMHGGAMPASEVETPVRGPFDFGASRLRSGRTDS